MNAAPSDTDTAPPSPSDGAAFVRPPRRVLAYIGMGANLGDAQAALEAAMRDIAALPGIHGVRVSPLYCSAPIDAGGPDYLNGVLETHTTLEAEDLLRALHGIENHHGRERPYRNAPRTLDLDLLLHGDEMRQTPFLTLPHPRMHLRAFVLRPLLDLDPELRLPQGSVAALLAACDDQPLHRLPTVPAVPGEPGEAAGA